MIVAPMLPFDGISHAGGLYLQHLHKAVVTMGTEVTFLVPDAPHVRSDETAPGAPQRIVYVGGMTDSSSPGARFVRRVVRRLDRTFLARNPTWPPLVMLTHLALTPAARHAIQRADVIDLQWPEYARAASVVRLMNPRARLVATLHDVLSQRLDRLVAAGRQHPGQEVDGRVLRSARRLEGSVANRASAVVVFSDKDRDLIVGQVSRGTRTHVHVVDPPLAPRLAPERAVGPGRPVVVFVGLLPRVENDDAARWLVTDIWPRVIEQVPQALLKIVGRDPSQRLLQAVATTPSVLLTGFVTDLAAAYAAATACVVPLRLGAGVKFKTVEALIAGVPTVTTSVGAEGIAGPERFVAVTDDAKAIATALVTVLRHPEPTERAAREGQRWAMNKYSRDSFIEAVGRIYGFRPSVEGRQTQPCRRAGKVASVVVCRSPAPDQTLPPG